jgi:hypothetical protein
MLSTIGETPTRTQARNHRLWIKPQLWITSAVA